MVKKRLSTDEKISVLRELVEHSPNKDVFPALQQALKEKSNFLVAKAAAWVAQGLHYDLVDDLLASYRRFMRQATDKDKTCAAKRSIIRALYELDYDDVQFYREAIRYVQAEPAYGGAVDTAIELRCTAAMGLTASTRPRIMLDLIYLLNDNEYQARIGALKAMELVQPYEAELALRQKILQGDIEPEVTAQCFFSLIKVAADESIEFIAEYLQHNDLSIVEGAALALGESRHEDALSILLEHCNAFIPSEGLRAVYYKSIALQRSDKAFSYLLGVIEDENAKLAQSALEALAIYSYNKELLEKVKSLVHMKCSSSLRESFNQHWLED